MFRIDGQLAENRLEGRRAERAFGRRTQGLITVSRPHARFRDIDRAAARRRRDCHHFLERRFRQDEVLIRASEVRRL